MRTRFILINTSHAGNVGAAARAMKVMGFDDLVLVAPRWPNVLTREETIQRASGATDVLAKARDRGHAGRGAGRHDLPVRHRHDAARFRAAHRHPARAPGPAWPARDHSVAFLFGSERFGMRNEDVYRCHVALTIPTDPRFGSLNLACGGPGDRLRMAHWRWAAFPVAPRARPRRSWPMPRRWRACWRTGSGRWWTSAFSTRPRPRS